VAGAAAAADFAGSVAPGVAGITGCDAAPDGAAADGAPAVGGADGGATLWRCAPRLLPPPRRRASAKSAMTIVASASTAPPNTNARFIVTPMRHTLPAANQ
jgi:hypothetical protein